MSDLTPEVAPYRILRRLAMQWHLPHYNPSPSLKTAHRASSSMGKAKNVFESSSSQLPSSSTKSAKKETSRRLREVNETKRTVSSNDLSYQVKEYFFPDVSNWMQ
jgi:hypothetical protein